MTPVAVSEWGMVDSVAGRSCRGGLAMRYSASLCHYTTYTTWGIRHATCSLYAPRRAFT